jgi:LPPG:FO 2-phospho-L-lactate transferase
VELIARRRPEVVFHLAAQSSVAVSVRRPVLDAEVNVVGSLQVLEGARAGGARKVVYAASGGTLYGDISATDLPVAEHHPRRPLSPYGVAKAAVIDYLVAYRELYGLDFTALALSNVYGPRQDPHGEAGVVAIFAADLVEGRVSTIDGDGSQTRDFVYVDDVVDAFSRAAGRAGGLVVNVGTGTETSITQLYWTMAAVQGSATPAPRPPDPAGRPRRATAPADRATSGAARSIRLAPGSTSAGRRGRPSTRVSAPSSERSLAPRRDRRDGAPRLAGRVITVLCGGVGAARFLRGLALAVDPHEITAVVNTGDDSDMHGLRVCPDLDTVTYTLAGAVDPATGWGLAGETFAAMDALDRYGAPTWFRLGDRDLGTHLFRTGRLSEGASLSDVTGEVGRAWGCAVRILPMSDDPVRTRLELLTGEEVDFQEYFVHLRHDVAVRSVRFAGAETAKPAPGVLAALAAAEVVVVAPSNPVVSIGPVLAVDGVADAVEARRDHVVAVSPIVGGRALKGPAGRLLEELGGECSVVGVARMLAPRAGTLVIDEIDAELVDAVRAEGMACVVTRTIMSSVEVAAELARVVLSAGGAGRAG